MERRQLLMDVITADSAHAAKILFQRVLIQVKARDSLAVLIFHLPLQQTMAAADFGDLRCCGNQPVVESLQDFKTTTNPEMIDRGDFEPANGNAHSRRGKKV